MEYFLVRYDSRVVIYERKTFIRLATAWCWLGWGLYGDIGGILSRVFIVNTLNFMTDALLWWNGLDCTAHNIVKNELPFLNTKLMNFQIKTIQRRCRESDKAIFPREIEKHLKSAKTKTFERLRSRWPKKSRVLRLQRPRGHEKAEFRDRNFTEFCRLCRRSSASFSSSASSPEFTSLILTTRTATFRIQRRFSTLSFPKRANRPESWSANRKRDLTDKDSHSEVKLSNRFVLFSFRFCQRTLTYLLCTVR